jgi:hypothetical protein
MKLTRREICMRPFSGALTCSSDFFACNWAGAGSSLFALKRFSAAESVGGNSSVGWAQPGTGVQGSQLYNNGVFAFHNLCD